MKSEQVPVDIAILVERKTRTDRSIERNRIRVVIISNPHMQTPHFEVKRLRNEVDLETWTEAEKPETAEVATT